MVEGATLIVFVDVDYWRFSMALCVLHSWLLIDTHRCSRDRMIIQLVNIVVFDSKSVAQQLRLRPLESSARAMKSLCYDWLIQRHGNVVCCTRPLCSYQSVQELCHCTENKVIMAKLDASVLEKCYHYRYPPMLGSLFIIVGPMSVRPSVCLYFYLSVCLSVCLSACMSVCLPVCLSVCLTV